ASIAHEIRNPLGAISHAAQLLGESTSMDDADKRLADIIQDHCVRMNNVIENVLQMSRRKTAEPKVIDINAWLSDFIEQFSAGFSGEIEVEIETDNSLKGFTVEFDPAHLSQVLGNLCQNGLRYSEKHVGKAKLRIKAGTEQASGPSIEIIDFGQGVAEDLVSNLFEPFYTTEVSGTGLGLYLSQELCEANNARLGYSKADTGGSCFKISFMQQVRH
ncbi:MAG: HAMP domain-containing sensor histidine kinase, partial [Pseudomonadales bacterium]|nr:HAMP domain-containing sensor histidine kinase [Pseudomonadales bacterium]